MVFLAATGFGAVIAHSNHVRDESISAIDDLFEFGTAVFNNSLFALILLVMAITIPKRIVRVIAKSSLKMSFVELDNKTLDKVDPMTSSLSAFFAFMTVAIAYSMRWELSTATELYQIASMFAFVLFYTLVCAGFEGYFYSREYKYGCSQSSANMAISHVASLGFLVFAFVHIFDLLLLLEQSGMVEALVLEHKQR
ncbi:TPA: hypothetical protein I7730_01510 [Vibrio vulnificus]|uniref:Uncharacterized protein n=1 Tax=Vibrio vulnificus TaxID=672 RepID=A0A8H9K5H2_VIBVL|nr:hypothetical protein [Vibrio vulnificus]